MADLTPKQRALLEPWANAYVRLDERLDRMSDDDLGELYAALEAPNQGNCWYAIFRAAEALKPIVARKCGERTMQKIKSMDDATPPTSK